MKLNAKSNIFAPRCARKAFDFLTKMKAKSNIFAPRCARKALNFIRKLNAKSKIFAPRCARKGFIRNLLQNLVISAKIWRKFDKSLLKFQRLALCLDRPRRRLLGPSHRARRARGHLCLGRWCWCGRHKCSGCHSTRRCRLLCWSRVSPAHIDSKHARTHIHTRQEATLSACAVHAAAQRSVVQGYSPK